MKYNFRFLPFIIIFGGLILRWLYPLDRLFEFDQDCCLVMAFPVNFSVEEIKNYLFLIESAGKS